MIYVKKMTENEQKSNILFLVVYTIYVILHIQKSYNRLFRLVVNGLGLTNTRSGNLDCNYRIKLRV